MTLSTIDQAFYDLYSSRISQCDAEILLDFLTSQRTDEGQNVFYKNYSSYYSHLMDTYIAFEAGIEYASKPKPVKCIVINGNPAKGHTFHGVFKNHEEATAWGKDNFDDSGFFVTEIKEIEE